MVHSFYDVLGLEKNSSLEEIKVAFKRQALQVHPDKGGSKEAFHAVYQGFETLADPEARKKHDHLLAALKPKAALRPVQKRKKAAASSSKCSEPKSEGPSTPTSRARASVDGSTGRETHETRILRRIHILLQHLPRDVRHDVIKKDFSEKQRLILEKWMRQSQTPLVSASGMDQEQAVSDKTRQTISSALVLSSTTTPSTCFNMPNNAETASLRGRLKGKKQDRHKQKRSVCGSIRKAGGRSNSKHYVASIFFDGIGLTTRKGDLPTILEFVVILTAVKGEMLALARTGSCSSFEKNLQDALMQLSNEHGRDYEDLGLRFSVVHKSTALLGPGFRLQSPLVYSIEDLGKLRSYISPFSQYAKNMGCKIFWRYSPKQLQDAWQRFQAAVAEAWAAAGADITKVLRRIRACHDANDSRRDRHLQLWERRHMARHDEEKHRPATLQSDYQDRKRDSGEPLCRVRKLLARWRVLLRERAQLKRKERRQAMQKQTKARKDRIEELKRKRDENGVGAEKIWKHEQHIIKNDFLP